MKADVKSSGIAAPMAQPHQAGELGISLACYSDDLKNGANNFLLMLARVREIDTQSSGETPDYKAIAFEIETSIYANLMGQGKLVRQGFLRAFSEYLSVVEAGFVPATNWHADDLLELTAAAYSREGVAA